MNQFDNAYNSVIKNASGVAGTMSTQNYIESIELEIRKIIDALNNNNFNNLPYDKSKGFIAEILHSGTYNINATVKGSLNRALKNGFNNFASADVTLLSGENASLKYYQNATLTARQQAKNAIESYYSYLSKGGTDGFEKYLSDRNIANPNMSIYVGQIKVVPKEQLEEIVNILKKKIAKFEGIKPEQAKRYLEVLNTISDRITDSKGISSIPLSTDEAIKLAKAAQEGNVTEETLRKMGISLDQLISLKDIARQAIKSGLSAAIVSAVLHVAPLIFETISQLIYNGQVDKEDFKRLGLDALSQTSQSFVQGAIAGGLTIACQSQMLGESLKSFSSKVIGPPAIASITIFTFDMIKNSILVANGQMTPYELTNNSVTQLFSIALGCVGGILIPQLATLGFMLGSFLGTVLGSAAQKLTMSFCVESGFTMFGLVEQDYTLPKEVLEQIGVKVFDYEKFEYKKFEYKKFEYKKFEYKKFEYKKFEFHHYEPKTINIKPLRRGVIGVAKIGYII